MKVLVVNPNTSAAVTERFVAEIRRIAPAGVTIDGVTGQFGAAIVSTRAENVVAAHSALTLLARHAAGYDAAILAISFDSGLAAANDIAPMPVVGITHSAIGAARASGRSVGLVLFGRMSLPLYEDLVSAYRLQRDIAGIETIEISNAGDYLDETAHDDAVIAAIDRLTRFPGLGAIVICGAAIVGMARRLQPRAAVPLFDGAAPSLAEALRLASMPRAVRALARPLSAMTGVDPALAALVTGTVPSPSSGSSARKDQAP